MYGSETWKTKRDDVRSWKSSTIHALRESWELQKCSSGLSQVPQQCADSKVFWHGRVSDHSLENELAGGCDENGWKQGH